MALAQQDRVGVNVLISVSVTQVELEHITDVTIQHAHQGARTAHPLKGSRGFRRPASLRETEDNRFNMAGKGSNI